MSGRKFALLLGLALALTANRAAADNSWYTIAIAASRNETAAVQELLLDRMNDPDILDSTSGRTALDFAASFDNLQMAQILLDHGAHVDARDSFGNSALHWAAERGNLDVMKLLIENKATIDFANRQGITPIMVAAEHTQPPAVRLLVASGADPHKQDFTGRDAFGWAAGRPATVQALNAKR
jgi:26S proteasome non-ATPase regulatory subunit 10